MTFSCISDSFGTGEDSSAEPTITLLERRRLVSGSRVTGFRTWEGSLHLGSYLLTGEGGDIIRGKNVLELGAGTGFLSLLCAKHLRAKHATATDGDEDVVGALRKNAALNDLDDGQRVSARVLRWGEDLEGTWVERECEARPYDVVIGADIVGLKSCSTWPRCDNGDQTADVTSIPHDQDIRKSRDRGPCSDSPPALRSHPAATGRYQWRGPERRDLRNLPSGMQ